MGYSKDTIYNTVEVILKKYKTYKALAKLDEEELSGLFLETNVNYDQEIFTGKTSDKTFDIVDRRNRPTLNMKKVRAIEIIFESLHDEEKEFCKQFFFEQKTKAQVTVFMHIEKDKFYSLKKEVLEKYRNLLPWKTFGENQDDIQTNNRQLADKVPNIGA